MSERRTIVVTGATRGLGRALVDRLVERGHVVHGCGRSPEHVAQLSATHPPPHTFAVLDVSDDAAVAAWAEDVLAAGDCPDLVINNAALMNDTARLWEIPAADFGRLMDVNVDGTVNVIRAFAPALIRAACGVIANLSSGWGHATAAHVAPYCASKFAIEGLTRALAQELPRPLAAVAVSPGLVDTDMLRQCWADDAGAYPGPESWSHGAIEVFLGLGPADNGASLRI